MGYLANKRYRPVARLPQAAMGATAVEYAPIMATKGHMAGMGDTLSTIEGILGEAGALAQDPYTGEILCHLQQIAQSASGQAVGQCTNVPYGTPSPAGLGTIIYPVRFIAYAQQNPWVWALALGVVFGLPMYLGYGMGYSDGEKRERRKAATP